MLSFFADSPGNSRNVTQNFQMSSWLSSVFTGPAWEGMARLSWLGSLVKYQDDIDIPILGTNPTQRRVISVIVYTLSSFHHNANENVNLNKPRERDPVEASCPRT